MSTTAFRSVIHMSSGNSERETKTDGSAASSAFSVEIAGSHIEVQPAPAVSHDDLRFAP